jgi:hypothetical protein
LPENSGDKASGVNRKNNIIGRAHDSANWGSLGAKNGATAELWRPKTQKLYQVEVESFRSSWFSECGEGSLEMAKKGHREEEILRELRDAESRATVVEICREHGKSRFSVEDGASLWYRCWKAMLGLRTSIIDAPLLPAVCGVAAWHTYRPMVAYVSTRNAPLLPSAINGARRNRSPREEGAQ